MIVDLNYTNPKLHICLFQMQGKIYRLKNIFNFQIIYEIITYQDNNLHDI
jgi:hypothetical protein